MMVNQELKQFYQFMFGSAAIIPDTAFSLYQAKATAELDKITNNKFSELTDSDNKKLCLLETAELMYNDDNRKNITSESNDGYSVTYDSSSKGKSVYEIAQRYLSGTGVLYRGFDDAD